MRAMCYRCMSYTGENGYCTRCGAPIRSERELGDEYLLPLGARLDEGKIIIGEKLGRGGFGITYRALDIEKWGLIALKEFVPTFMIRSMRVGYSIRVDEKENANYLRYKAFFAKEAETLAKLQHPNIVRVFFQFDENNTSYYGMELLTGVNLQQWIEQRGRMNAPDAFRLLKPIFSALEYVHSQNMLHRDISPANIFLREKTGEFMDVSPCLIDFGAAYEAKVGFSKSAPHIKNLGFSPPEQNAGHKILGTYSDIYSICAVLYYMLTGRKPESAENRALYGTELEAPCVLISEIPRAFSDVILRGMSVDYKQRIQTIPELCRQLQEALREAPANTSDSWFGKIKKNVELQQGSPADESIILTSDAHLQGGASQRSGNPRPLIACLIDMALFGGCWALLMLAEPIREVLNGDVWIAGIAAFALALICNFVMCMLVGGTPGEVMAGIRQRNVSNDQMALHTLLQTMYPVALFRGAFALVTQDHAAPADYSIDVPPQPAMPVEAYLTGELLRKQSPLKRENVLTRQGKVLGRAAKREVFCDIPVSWASCVSRRHCQIDYDNGWYLTDLGSKNGTFINGRRLKKNGRCQIYEGDTIGLGDERICVVFHLNRNQETEGVRR